MKKIIIAGMCFISGNQAFSQSQSKPQKDTTHKGVVARNDFKLHISVGYTVEYVSTTSLVLFTIKNVKMFAGFNVAPYIRPQKIEPIFPYLSTHRYYGSVYGGIIRSIKKFDFGLGIELQKTTKIGDTVFGIKNQPFTICPRIFTKGTIGKSQFLLTCNVGKRLFDVWGYWIVPVSKKIDIGAYTNISSVGYGPLIKWGLKKRKTHNFGCSIGYNFSHENYGVALMAQNF